MGTSIKLLLPDHAIVKNCSLLFTIVDMSQHNVCMNINGYILIFHIIICIKQLKINHDKPDPNEQLQENIMNMQLAKILVYYSQLLICHNLIFARTSMGIF